MTIITDHGETEVIETTPSHPFYSADRRDYIPAAQLRLEERLRTADDPPGHASARVKSLVPRAPPQGEPGFRVYNLEVHGLHTYHVGDAGVLVHNSCQNIRANAIKGKRGETMAGIIKANKERIKSLSNSGKYRIPDEYIKNKWLREVKNSKEVRLTEQIKYFILFCKDKNIDFILQTRRGTRVSNEIAAMAKKLGVEFRHIDSLRGLHP